MSASRHASETASSDLRVAVSPETQAVLSVGELLEHDAMLGARLAAGRAGLDRGIARLNFMSVPDIVRWTKRDEFLLTTGYPLPRDVEEFCALIEQLAGKGLAGLGIKLDQYMASLPAEVLATGDRASFPIVLIPQETALDDVLSQAFATIVNRQARALKVTHEIHHTLLDVALSGGGLSLLVDELSGILGGAAVAVVDDGGLIRASTEDLGPFDAASLLQHDGTFAIDVLRREAQDDGPGSPWSAAVISAGHMTHGYVVAIEGGERRLPFVATTAVEQAALVAALEITKELAVASVERHFASNALHDLVTGVASDVVDPVAHAVTFGWDLGRPLVVLVAREDEVPQPPEAALRARELAALRVVSQWTSLVRGRDRGAAAAGFATELVAVVGSSDPAEFGRLIKADMASVSLSGFSIGVSEVGAAVEDVPRLYQEARTALSVGRRLSGAGAVTDYAGLGIYRLIRSVNAGDLHTFVDDVLRPVLELSEPSRTDLLETLATLLDNRFNVAETARSLHYHYNTMRYRVAKLERLLGAFVDDAEASLRIGVALRIFRMDEVSGRGGISSLSNSGKSGAPDQSGDEYAVRAPQNDTGSRPMIYDP